MNTLVERYMHNGYKVEIHQDDNPNSPRDWSNACIMALFHNKYTLGDKHDFSVESLKDFMVRSNCFRLPVYIYDHSGISISTSRRWPFNCRWDSGMIGYIFITRKNARKEFGSKLSEKELEEKALKCMEQEVKIYNQYLVWDVYGYIIFGKEGEVSDSCWGYYGVDAAKQEANSIIDAVDPPLIPVKDTELFHC